MEVYITRTAEAWKNRGNRGGVPGAEGLDDTIIGLGTGTTVTTNKDAKKLEEATEKVKEHGGAHRTNGDNQTARNPTASQKSVAKPIEQPPAAP